MGWRTSAACRGLPITLFFPEAAAIGSHLTYDAGRAVCARCTVRDECFLLTSDLLETGDRDGLFGGLSPSERRHYRSARYAGEYDHLLRRDTRRKCEGVGDSHGRHAVRGADGRFIPSGSVRGD